MENKNNQKKTESFIRYKSFTLCITQWSRLNQHLILSNIKIGIVIWIHMI